MALTALTLSCLLLYSTSKYFPLREDLQKKISALKNVIIGVAIVLLLLSLWWFTFEFDGTTAFVIWLTALMTILSALILTVKLSLRWLYCWAVLCVLFMVIDFI